MNWADFMILGVILLSSLIGVWRGLMKESISLATWILAFWVAIMFADLLAGQLARWVETPSLRLIVAFAILFVLVLVIGGIINHVVGLAIEKTGLSGTDRTLGIFFGLARGFVLAAVLVLLGTLFGLPRDPWWDDSALIPWLEPMAGWMQGFLPDSVQQPDVPLS